MSPKSLKAGFSGSRSRHNSEIEEKVREIISKLTPADEVCHGGCPRGADAFAQKWAEFYGIPTKIFYPEKPKAKYYLKRNTELAKYIDILYAFPRSRESVSLR